MTILVKGLSLDEAFFQYCHTAYHSEPSLDDDFGRPIMDCFGTMIKEIRREARLTQHELADKARVSRGAVRKIECSGRGGHIDTIQRLALALGYEVDLIAVCPLTPKPSKERKRSGRARVRGRLPGQLQPRLAEGSLCS